MSTMYNVLCTRLQSDIAVNISDSILNRYYPVCSCVRLRRLSFSTRQFGIRINPQTRPTMRGRAASQPTLQDRLVAKFRVSTSRSPCPPGRVFQVHLLRSEQFAFDSGTSRRPSVHHLLIYFHSVQLRVARQSLVHASRVL